MGRIEEIKLNDSAYLRAVVMFIFTAAKKSMDSNVEFITWNTDESLVCGKQLNDIATRLDTLLSRLQIAERALEVALKRIKDADDDAYNEYGFGSIYEHSEEYKAIEQALEQIRRD